MEILNPSHIFTMVDFITDPAIAGMFAAFAAGLTQIVKSQLKLDNHLQIQGISVAAFVVGVLLHYALPETWQLIFDLVAGGVGTTGGVGLIKEVTRAKPPAVLPAA